MNSNQQIYLRRLHSNKQLIYDHGGQGRKECNFDGGHKKMSSKFLCNSHENCGFFEF